MGNFDRGNRSSGGRSYGRPRSGSGGRSFGGGSRDFGPRGDREMHHAVCSNCGRDCEVPFKPTGSKPVLCNDCFAKNRDAVPRRFSDRGPRRDFGPREGGQPQNNKQLEIINAKLDQVLALLNGAPKGKSAKAPKVSKTPKVETPQVETSALDVSDVLEVPEAEKQPTHEEVAAANEE